MTLYSALPSYNQSLRLSLLCLDGGGTRIYIQLQMLSEIMHRLAWDMRLISSRPSTPQKCQIYPADCFDFIGAGGCGAISAFLLAAGHTVKSALEQFHALAPILSSTRLHAHSTHPGESLTELRMALDASLPRHGLMGYRDEQGEEDWIVDIPSRTNVWIAGASQTTGANGKCNIFISQNGTLIKKGAPIRLLLLPLVLAEVEREMRGRQEKLDHTLEFLQAVCPVFGDCDLLLNLGSGEAPPPPSPLEAVSSGSLSPRREAETRYETEGNALNAGVQENQPGSPQYTELASWLTMTVVYLFTWLCLTTTTATTSPNPAVPPVPPMLLPRSTATREQSRALNAYIPTWEYGRSYIRLSPNVTTKVYGTLRDGLATYSSLSPPSSPISPASIFSCSRSKPSSPVAGTPSSSSSCSSFSGQVAWPADWEPTHFSEHRMMTASYCSRAEVGISMDRAVGVLGRRELPGVLHPQDAARGGRSATVTASWDGAPQYSQTRNKPNTPEDKQAYDALVFDMALYVS